jgi:hypothetical protein
MAKRRYKAEEIVTLLRQVEVAIAKGKLTPQAYRENGITEQTYYRCPLGTRNARNLRRNWRARRESNPQPSDPKSDALSS